MRTTTDHLRLAKAELRDQLDKLPESQRLQLSKRIAKFTAQAVREDRVRRMPNDSLAKLADVFFNGRRA